MIETAPIYTDPEKHPAFETEAVRQDGGARLDFVDQPGHPGRSGDAGGLPLCRQ